MIEGPLNGKVICVGFQKTGTTSLKSALRKLDLSVTQCFVELNTKMRAADEADWSQLAVDTTVNKLRLHDAIQDSPCAFVFKELDTAFPGAKFILTSREVESWFTSFTSHFGEDTNLLRRWMYGFSTLAGNEKRIREIYLAQNQKIRDYFRDRPADFLEMDLAAGDGWGKLAVFLEANAGLKFPHSNSATARVTRQAAKKAALSGNPEAAPPPMSLAAKRRAERRDLLNEQRLARRNKREGRRKGGKADAQPNAAE